MNKHHLEGMRCPACGSFEPFRIEVCISAVIEDDLGIVDYYDNDCFDDTAYCECIKCSNYGRVIDFRPRDPVLSHQLPEPIE